MSAARPFSAFLVRVSLVLACLASLSSPAAEAQQPIRIPGVTAINTDAPPQTVTLTLTRGGIVDSIRVLTQGSAGSDFRDLGTGTCSAGVAYLPGQQCTVGLGLRPSTPGERRGAIVLLSRAALPLATQLLTAQASGPLATFVPGMMGTVAGEAAWIFNGDGGPATHSALFLPFGIALNAAGDIFIADSSNNRIRRVDAITNAISTVAGSGLIGTSGDGGPAVLAALGNPSSVALDSVGNIFFADSGNNAIRRIDAFTGLISTVAGTLGQHGDAGDHGPAIRATLNTPNGIAFDPAGNLYIADTGNHVIRYVDAATGNISTIAGTRVPTFGGDGGPALAAALNSPWSVTLSPSGELFIADQNNHRIRRIDTAGIISTVAGTGVPGFSGDAGPASAAMLNVPASVAIDVAGNLYIADAGNDRIRKVNAATRVISTIAGTSHQSFTGDSAPADQAGLYGPYSVALDAQGSLLIADVFHNRIRKVSSNIATLSYPPLRVGRVSLPQTQSIENDGNAPLDISSINPVSQSQVDALNTTCAPSSSFTPLDTCKVSVAFAPTATGTLVTGSALAVSDAANSPGTILLTGEVLSIDPATITLSSSLNPSSTGGRITLTAVVTSAGNTPTGTVTLLDGATPLAASPLQNGTVSFSLSFMQGGQHNLTASYAGDSSNAAAVSPVLFQIVKDAQASTLTSLASSANPSDAGAPFVLTANVTVATPGSGSGSITGTVTFNDGATLLGVATLANGSATLSSGSLTVGPHTLTAVYSGNSTYAASTSPALIEHIQLASTRASLSSSASPAIAGAPLVLSATLTSSGGVPTGPVAFLDSGTLIGSASLNAQGVATLAASHLAVGAHTLTAAYAGDKAGSPSVSPPFTQTVIAATSTLQLASSANPAALGGLLTLTASVSTNGGLPSGSIQFLDGSTVLGSAALNSSGAAVLSLSTLALGPHTITATYAGDASDTPATSTPLLQVIQPATIAVTLASSANPANFAAPVTLTAQVTGSGSTPSGSITFVDGATQLAALPVGPSGVVAYTASALGIGIHSIAAQYSGDSNHAATTSSPIAQRILQTTAIALSLPSTQSVAGLPVSFSATLSGSSGIAVSGQIVFSDGGAPVATMATDAAGRAVFTSATLAPGTHSIVAAYAGDTLDAPSASAPVTLIVTIATTSTTIASASPNPALAGSVIVLTSRVSGNGAAPGGTVTFRDAGPSGTATLGTVSLTSAGIATLTTSSLTPGIHLLSAAYSGDVADQPSVSPGLSQQVAEQTSLTLASSANPALLTDTVILTVNVLNGVPGTPPTGIVRLTDAGVPVAAAPIGPSGSASFTLASPALGTHTFVASYAGDNNNTPAASAPLIQTVVLRPTTASFTASATALSAGQQLIVFSLVNASGAPAPTPRPPTGLVTFQSGATILGTATLDSSGLANATLNPAAGVYPAIALYSGDALYAPSTSSAILITVGPPVEFTLSAPAALQLQSGQHTTLRIDIASAASFSDVIALGCAGLPASATCTFSDNRPAVTGGRPSSVTLTLDTGNPLGAGASARLTPSGNQTGRSSLPLLCFIPGGSLFALLLWRSRRGTRSLALLSMLLVLALSSVLSGCASSFILKSTPPGSYTFQIVGSGIQTAATQAVNVQLKVTQ